MRTLINPQTIHLISVPDAGVQRSLRERRHRGVRGSLARTVDHRAAAAGNRYSATIRQTSCFCKGGSFSRWGRREEASITARSCAGISTGNIEVNGRVRSPREADLSLSLSLPLGDFFVQPCLHGSSKVQQRRRRRRRRRGSPRRREGRVARRARRGRVPGGGV